MQAKSQGEMTKMIGRELHLVSAGRELQFLNGHHAGIVDEDVERFVPFRHEGVDGISIDQVEVRDMNAMSLTAPLRPMVM